ncbi:hypothetical protein MG7_05718, partial [Candida albicans P34048]
DGKSFLGIKF